MKTVVLFGLHRVEILESTIRHLVNTKSNPTNHHGNKQLSSVEEMKAPMSSQVPSDTVSKEQLQLSSTEGDYNANGTSASDNASAPTATRYSSKRNESKLHSGRAHGPPSATTNKENGSRRGSDLNHERRVPSRRYGKGSRSSGAEDGRGRERVVRKRQSSQERLERPKRPRVALKGDLKWRRKPEAVNTVCQRIEVPSAMEHDVKTDKIVPEVCVKKMHCSQEWLERPRVTLKGDLKHAGNPEIVTTVCQLPLEHDVKTDDIVPEVCVPLEDKEKAATIHSTPLTGNLLTSEEVCVPVESYRIDEVSDVSDIEGEKESAVGMSNGAGNGNCYNVCSVSVESGKVTDVAEAAGVFLGDKLESVSGNQDIDTISDSEPGEESGPPHTSGHESGNLLSNFPQPLTSVSPVTSSPDLEEGELLSDEEDSVHDCKPVGEKRSTRAVSSHATKPVSSHATKPVSSHAANRSGTHCKDGASRKHSQRRASSDRNSERHQHRRLRHTEAVGRHRKEVETGVDRYHTRRPYRRH